MFKKIKDLQGASKVLVICAIGAGVLAIVGVIVVFCTGGWNGI